MRIVAGAGRCQGRGQCEDAAPGVFEVGEEDAVVHLRVTNPPERLRTGAEEAV